MGALATIFLILIVAAVCYWLFGVERPAEDILESLQIDGSLAVMIVIYAIAFFVVHRFFVVPFMRLLDERRREIDSAQALFDEAKAESEARFEQQRGRMADARGELRDRRDALRKEAQARRQELLMTARKDAEQQLDKAVSELDAQVAGERSALEGKATELASDLTRRLLGRAVS